MTDAPGGRGIPPRRTSSAKSGVGLIVTDGAGFFAEEKRDCTFELTRLEDGVPAFHLTNSHAGGRFRGTAGSMARRFATASRDSHAADAVRRRGSSRPDSRCDDLSPQVAAVGRFPANRHINGA